MHSLKKAIALFLVLALVVQVLPISIFAVDANSNRSLNQEMNTSESKPQALKEDDSEAQNPKVLGEVSELRGETQKHFRMDDGSFIAVDYGMPVHFSEDNGKTWKDIDNTLILNQGTKTGQKQAETVASYRAVNGESSQSFAADLQSGFLFSTQSGSHGLFFALEDTAVSPEAQGANGAEVNAQAERVRKAAPSERTEAQTGGTEADNTEPSAEPEELTETEERNAVNEPAEAEKAEEALPVEELACEENATEEAETVENETLPTEASEAEPSETQALPEAEADESAAEETEAAEEDYSASVRAEISYPNRRGSKDNSVQQKRSAFKGNGLASSKETDECALSVAEQVAPEKLRADVLYRNVYQDVDLRYELYGCNVKETIVLKQPRSSYSFSFYMNLTDLQLELTEDGSVELRDEQGEVVYLIPAPYMIDAKGVASTEAYYTLEQTASGAWKLTVKASETWINAEDRAFPVEIDPTLISYAGAKDCHIYTSYVDSNKKESAAYYNTGFLRCGYAPSDSNCKGHTVGLLYFEELPKIPSHCVVTDAQLSLYQINGYKGGSFTQKLYATTISTPSNPKNYLNTMTWNKYLSEISGKYAKLGEASEVTVLDYHVERNHCWIESTYVITDAVQQWYDPNGSSISRLLVLDDGHNGTSEARATYAGYTSNGYRPIICVTYRNIAGIEGIYGYHTQNIGRAGTGYVNNFTMQPSLSVPVMSAPSGILPFGISLYYNEVLSYSHFTSSTTLAVNYGGIHTLPYANAKTGYGWKTSVQQTVRYVLYDLDGDYSTEYDQSKWLIYTDADGTEHYFCKANGGIGTIYGRGRIMV